jgi:hypothetical protein
VKTRGLLQCALGSNSNLSLYLALLLLSLMSHGRYTKAGRKVERKSRNISSRHQQPSHCERGIHPTPRTKYHSTREQTPTHNSQNPKHTGVSKKHFSLCQRNSAHPELFWRTQPTNPDPKLMRVRPLCFWEVKTLDKQLCHYPMPGHLKVRHPITPPYKNNFFQPNHTFLC